MIPERVHLRGFLCYKEEQEIRFDGASVWMLAGLNGSGKSTIFDAVTYALFGHHRGGGSDAHELINKDGDRAAVTVDFALDGQRFRVQRTLQRTKQGKAKSTQQIYRRSPLDGWDAVEGTNLRAGFDEWVQQNVGLSYETFTSSVLLLQGKAEKLLDSTAKGRFEVLAGIVDLERFERLHEKADEERKALKTTVENLTNRLDAIPEVSAIALIEAEGRIAAAESARDQARLEVERRQQLGYRAEQWAKLQAQLAEVRERLRNARQLVADGPAIEQAVERLRELREVVPRVQTIIEQRQQIHESEWKTAELTKQRQQGAAKLAEQDEALTQARQKRTDLQNRTAEDEARLRQVQADRGKLALLVEKLREYERQEADLKRLQEDLARMPADPAAQLRQAREVLDALDTLARVAPLLARLHGLREELRQATAREKTAVETRQAIQKRGEQLKEAVEKLRPQVEEAAAARQQAEEEATRSRTLQEQARQGLNELHLLRGAKVCRHCGQKLTAAHVAEEKERRTAEVAQADERAREAAAKQKTARERERQLRAEFDAADRQLREAREGFAAERKEADQARKEVERLQRDCGEAYIDLPEVFRNRVAPKPPADWLATAYPGAEDVTQARQQANGLAAAKRGLGEAEAVLQKWGEQKAAEATVRQNLARLAAELPPKRESLRQEHVRLETEGRELEKTVTARRAQEQETQKQLDRLTREREQTQHLLTQLQGHLDTEEATRKHCRQALDKARKELPASWHGTADRAGTEDFHRLRSERDELARQPTEERAQQLQQARASLEVQEAELTGLEKQQEQYPEEARQEPERVEALLQEARRTYSARDEELSAARQEKALLERQHEQRERLQQEKLKADEALNHAKLLAELLGRDRLQLHLVRTAERQVVDHANSVLDRLSGGQLYLRLAGEAGGEGTTAKALELEAHNRVTGEKPINVAFLSGSQKFRVAVSLALGIGQYASRQHRPIESVIIDEGFGCLDRHGRQVMIQELQNLRGQLRCILLVSHQDEIAEAFSDGYHFELQGGTTVATRFQR